MKYLLDSDVCIVCGKGERRLALRALAAGTDDLAVSAITVCELIYGAHESAYPDDNLAHYRNMFDRMTELSVDRRVEGLRIENWLR